MQERGIDGGMGAVIGLSDEQVHDIVDQAREHGEISVANRNAPGQIVLSGVIPALVFALEMSKTVGARKAARLTVSVASHSPLMRRARDEFGRILAKVPFRDPKVPMLGNVHGSVIQYGRRPATRADRAPRPWRAVDETVRRMAADGVTDFVEVGRAACSPASSGASAPGASAHAVDAPVGPGGTWQPDVTDRRAVVTGLGVVSPVGIGADASWEALVAGRSGIDRHHPLRHDRLFEIDVAGEVKGFDATQYMDAKDARRHDRNTHFAVAATGEALRDAGLLGEDGRLDAAQAEPDRFGMVFGTGIGGIGMISDGHEDALTSAGLDRVSPFLLAHMIPDCRLRAGGHPVRPARPEHGGRQRLRHRRPRHRRGDGGDRARPGGPHARRRHRGAGRAAGVRRLRPDARARHADRPRHRRVQPGHRSAGRSTRRATGSSSRRARRCSSSRSSSTRVRAARRPIAEVIGYGSSADAFDMAAPAERGEGNQRAMRAALARAGIGPEAVDYINAHGTRTPLNDRFETVAIRECSASTPIGWRYQQHQEHDRPHDGRRRRDRGVRVRQGVPTGCIPPTINLPPSRSRS